MRTMSGTCVPDLQLGPIRSRRSGISAALPDILQWPPSLVLSRGGRFPAVMQPLPGLTFTFYRAALIRKSTE